MNFFKYVFMKLGLYTPPAQTLTTTTASNMVDINVDGAVKVALCIGINTYPNPANNLSGCVNDANDWANTLRTLYHFDATKVLLNSDATRSNFISNAEAMIASKPDLFVITNSSHGTRVDSDTEEDGYCEAICLYDKFLMDHDFKTLLGKADSNTKVVVISDSCHSAGVTREFLATMNDFSYESKPRYLPPQDNMEALRVSMIPIVKAIFEPRENMTEILLAGCKSDQYSYDANFDGRPNGAFTYYLLKIIKENPSLTYSQLIQKMSEFLPSGHYPQCPVLETDDKNKDLVIFS